MIDTIEELRAELVKLLAEKLVGNRNVPLKRIIDGKTYNFKNICGWMPAMVTLVGIHESFREIIFNVQFYKYEKEIIIYTSPKFSIDQIYNAFVKKVNGIVWDTLIENNEYDIIEEYNKKNPFGIKDPVAFLKSINDLNFKQL